MAEHESCIGATDEWYTPGHIFEAMNLCFYLDPCAPLRPPWPAIGWCARWFTKKEDGLAQPWHGTVFMNPPFGGRNGHVPWLERFIDHGNGVCIVRAYTSSGWWHKYMPKMEVILFPKGKTKFLRPNGSEGKSPGHGIALASIGCKCNLALINSKLGMVWRL